MIPVAIVAHPKRRAWVSKLANEVQAEAVCWDSQYEPIGGDRNHIRAWRWLAETGAPWGVVLEDDVLPCEDFHDQLTMALLHAPSNIVSLYLGRGRPPHMQERVARAISQDVSYVTSQVMMSCQGYAMRTELFREHPKVTRVMRDNREPIDEAMTRWIRKSRRLVSYTRFSLVDHRDGPTLIDHPDGQPRNGTTALWAPGCDPRGARLPEIRKAWLRAPIGMEWTTSSVAL